MTGHFMTPDPLLFKSFSSNHMGEKTWCLISKNMLQVGYSGKYIVSQPEGITGPVKLIKENIDNFDIVKTWINLCQSQHTKICSVDNRSSVPGLILIDCDTRFIVAGKDHPYVALSYVWESSLETSNNSNKLSENLPSTIEDAIIVTKRLGYRYVWIDRYCIDQKNKEITTDQVGKMDLIYQNAELTIVAAIGEDPSYGLPGVGERKREPQYLSECTKVGRHFLISVDGSPKEATRNTKWETRAWTYQEVLLSRRRLVFTKEQMFFECYGMYCCESLDLPLKNLHRKDMQDFKSAFCSKDKVGIFPKGVGTTPLQIVKHIEEYSKRKLTNPSDILKGMLRIFNAFQRSRLHIHHCAGIPILPSMRERYLGAPIQGCTQSMSFFTGLFWNLKTQSKRRHGFPSWCWTGWYGPVEWNGNASRSWPSIKVDPNVEARVKLLDGRILTLETFQLSHSHLNLSNTIQITAWTIEVKILKRLRYELQEDQHQARLKLEDGGYLDWSFKSISKLRLLPGKLCKGIILGHHFDGDTFPSTGPAILVCGKVGDTFEWISLSWVDQFFYKRYDKGGNWEFKDRMPIIRVNPILETPLELVKSWEETQLE